MSAAEIITPEEGAALDLASLASGIKDKWILVRQHEVAMLESTLEHRLEIGRDLAKAQATFGLTVAQVSALGGEATKAVARHTTAPIPLGFSNWIKTAVPGMNRSTARKYAFAYNALGLGLDADTKAIRERIKTLRHEAGQAGKPMPTLESICKLGRPKNEAPLQIGAPDTAQLRLEDARETFHLWGDQFDEAVRRGQLDDLDREGLLALKERIASFRDRVNARLTSGGSPKSSRRLPVRRVNE